MGKQTTNSKTSYKGRKQYPSYKAQGRALVNRLKRLSTYVVKNPNDEQASEALEKLKKRLASVYYRRKIPGSHSYITRLLKEQFYYDKTAPACRIKYLIHSKRIKKIPYASSDHGGQTIGEQLQKLHA